MMQVGNARGRAKPDPVQCFQLLQASEGHSARSTAAFRLLMWT